MVLNCQTGAYLRFAGDDLDFEWLGGKYKPQEITLFNKQKFKHYHSFQYIKEESYSLNHANYKGIPMYSKGFLFYMLLQNPVMLHDIARTL